MPVDALPAFELNSDRELLRELRSSLDHCGYTEENVRAALGVEQIPGARSRMRNREAYLAKTVGQDPIALLVRLFLLNERLKSALLTGKIDVDLLENVGLLRRDRETVSATVELAPFGGFLLASDLQDRGADQVMGIAASTLALHQFTIRRKVGSVLDLGTGCGVQALVASGYADRVTAVDVNPRSVKMARFNARLNDISNIEFACGDLFEPVRGQKFDLIVCNPPFVVGPAVSPVHTSSGESGDHFCERILRDAPAFLNEDGFAQVLCNWAESENEAGRERMTSWLRDTGCDAWVLHSHTESANEYARARANETAASPYEKESLGDRWLQYFEREAITGINFGVVSMRRSSKMTNWIRYDELPGANGHCGRSIEAGFTLHDYIEEHGADEILDVPLTHARRIDVFDDGREKKKRTQLRLKEGLTFTVAADPEVAALVESCGGKTTLRDYGRRLAAKKHIPISYVLPALASVAKPLIEFGFLLPVEIASKLDP